MNQKAPVVIGFVYLFLVMTSYYILKPVRESFFLGEQGYKNLPLVHLLVLAATFLTVILYSWAARKFGPSRLIIVANIFFLVCITGFWLVLTQLGDQPLVRKNMAWAYFCWVSVFAVFAVTLFWSVVHTIFSTEGGSKSYGIIGAGATIGAMTGGFLTKFLAEKAGTENLLIIAAGLLTPCVFLGFQLAKHSKTNRSDPSLEAEESRAEKRKRYRPAIEIFKTSPFLCALGAVVFLGIFISILDDYRYGIIINESFPKLAAENGGELTPDQMETQAEINDKRTAFYGNIYFYTNVVGLFFSLILTGPIQERFGPGPGMLLYTLVVMATAIGFLIQPSLNLVFWASVAVQSVAYSIFQWSRELLYTVTTEEEKLVGKGIIDTFLFRAGAAGAAISLLMAARIGVTESMPDGVLTGATRTISYVIIPVVLVVVGIILWLIRQFKRKQTLLEPGEKI